MKQSLLSALLLGALLIGCTDAQPSAPSNAMLSGNGSFELSKQEILMMDQETLTEEIREGLLFMREEEKLARDVYQDMGKRYPIRVFRNIAVSEQRHMDAILLLLNKYGIEDPVGEDTPGVFRNAELQKLYDDLITAGSVSQTEALKVGKLIEETDIADLEQHIAELQEESDILRVYHNLKRASENHLRAFNRQLP